VLDDCADSSDEDSGDLDAMAAARTGFGPRIAAGGAHPLN
jgi:hypothetical protein